MRKHGQIIDKHTHRWKKGEKGGEEEEGEVGGQFTLAALHTTDYGIETMLINGLDQYVLKYSRFKFEKIAKIRWNLGRNKSLIQSENDPQQRVNTILIDPLDLHTDTLLGHRGTLFLYFAWAIRLPVKWNWREQPTCHLMSQLKPLQFWSPSQNECRGKLKAQKLTHLNFNAHPKILKTHSPASIYPGIYNYSLL